MVVALVIAPGCARKKPAPEPLAAPLDYAHELPPGTVALRKISPGEYPDFSAAVTAPNLDAVVGAIGNSLAYLSRPSSRNAYPYLDVTHDRAVASLVALRELLNDPAVRANPNLLNQRILERFDVYTSVGAPRANGPGYTGKVLFTGYFTPTYEASLTRTGPFQWPLYRRPADLVSDAGGETLGRRTPDGQVVPYYSRAEIEGGGKLAGIEVVWLKDRWEAYVVTGQGSARLRLRDGRILELGYAGHNGHQYESPAMKMVADGVLRKEEISAAALRDHFAKHPGAMDKYLWHNPRTVFFADRPGGPFGSLNVPVTPMATIATDKKVYPPAMPAFIDTQRAPAGKAAWKQFMLDQDTGGAIRAAGRGDIYMGVGDEAEQRAGEQLSEGRLYYLALKPELVVRDQ